MNINDFVLANSAKSYLGLSPSVQSTGSVGSTGRTGLEKADKRIQSQVDVTSAQLSSFGKLKSSVSEAQTASRTLSKLSDTSTATTVKAAAQSFVDAFNSAVTTAKSTSGVAGETVAAQNASRVAKDLTGAVSQNMATIDALKKVGFSLQSDGTLSFDAKKFDAAQTADPSSLKATLAKVGQQVDKTTTEELASSGRVTTSVTSLTQRATVLKGQQDTLAALQQQSTSYLSSSYASYGGFGLFGS